VSRGKRRKAEPNQQAAGAEVAEPSSTARAETRDACALWWSWAQLIRQIYEVDPLVCPSCGSGMKVIAFIVEHEVVAAILVHLERKEAREARPPPI